MFPRGNRRETWQTWRCVRLIIASACRSEHKVITGISPSRYNKVSRASEKSSYATVKSGNESQRSARCVRDRISCMPSYIAVIEWLAVGAFAASSLSLSLGLSWPLSRARSYIATYIWMYNDELLVGAVVGRSWNILCANFLLLFAFVQSWSAFRYRKSVTGNYIFF